MAEHLQRPELLRRLAAEALKGAKRVLSPDMRAAMLELAQELLKRAEKIEAERGAGS
jgi:hypothetical protein